MIHLSDIIFHVTMAYQINFWNMPRLRAARLTWLAYVDSRKLENSSVWKDRIIVASTCRRSVQFSCYITWSKHISVITNKIAKNVCVMYRVRHLLTNTALYNLYCTLILPYLNYCCEAWGNTYKSRIQPLYIIQKKAIRICGNVDYRSHTRPLFYHWKTLGLYDIVHFNSMVFMFKVYANLLPTNLLSFF